MRFRVVGYLTKHAEHRNLMFPGVIAKDIHFGGIGSRVACCYGAVCLTRPPRDGIGKGHRWSWARGGRMRC